MSKFEQIVEEAIADASEDVGLLSVLRQAGWKGYRFNASPMLALDANALLVALSTLYLQSTLIAFGGRSSVQISGSFTSLIGPRPTAADDNNPRRSSKDTVASTSSKQVPAGYNSDLQVLSFCPNLLVRHVISRILIKDEDLSEVSSSSVQAACMLVDISGFSKFSGSMCSKGTVGLDDLHKATNGFLGHFVDVVHQYRGDVICFAGDALICVFTAGDNSAAAGTGVFSSKDTLPLSRDASTTIKRNRRQTIDCATPSRPVVRGGAGGGGGGAFRAVAEAAAETGVHYCLRALQCACELRDHKDDNLGTHIAVTSGPLSLAMLGGYMDEWTYIINGSCLSDLSTCIEDAGVREVCCSASTYELALLAGNHTVKVAQRGDNYLVLSMAETAGAKIMGPVQRRIDCYEDEQDKIMDALEAFTPFPALNAIYAESLDAIAELRQVTTMFLKLDSYSPVVHQDPLTLQDFFFLLQEVLDESGGFLRQFLVDDKGCVAIAMWGVPCFTYPNDCSRGLYCAVSMNQRVTEVGHRCSVGLTTGNVYCGNVGSLNRRDYVGIGDTVNLAARFMGKSKGKVFLDEATYDSLPRETKNFISPLAHELELKGQALPIRPYFYASELPPAFPSGDDTTAASSSEYVVLNKGIAEKLAAQLDRACLPSLRSGVVVAPYSRNTALISPPSAEKALAAPTIIVPTTAPAAAPPSPASQTLGKTGRRQSVQRMLPSLAENSSTVAGIRAVQNTSPAHVSRREGASMRVSVHGMGRDRSIRSQDRDRTESSTDAPQIATTPGSLTFTIVTGEGGSGKSTVTHHFLQGARKRNLKVVHVSARAGDECVNYGVATKVFWGLMNPDGALDLEDDEVRTRVLKEAVGKAYPALEGSNPKRFATMLEALETILGIAPDDDEADGKQRSRSSLLGHVGESRSGSGSNKNLLTGPLSSGSTMSRRRSQFKGRKVRTSSIAMSGDEADVSTHGSRREAESKVGSLATASSSTSATASLRLWTENLSPVDMAAVAAFSAVALIGSKDSEPRSLREELSRKFSFVAAAKKPTVGRKDKQLALVFYNVIKALLTPLRAAIVIEDAQFVDELSWIEMSHWPEMECQCTILISILSSSAIKQAAPSNDLTVSFLGDDQTERLQQVARSGIVIDDANRPILYNSETVILEMRPFDEPEVVELIQKYLGTERAVSPALVAAVMQASSGVPFWCVTIAKFILERGEEEFTRSMRSDQHGLDFLVICRLEKVSAEQQSLAKYASIVGGEFSVAMLTAVLPTRNLSGGAGDPSKLEEACHALLEAGFFMCHESQLPDAMYSLRNDFITKALYRLTPPSEAARIHLAAAHYIEDHHQDDLQAYYDLLAYHYVHCSHPDATAVAFKYACDSATYKTESFSFTQGLLACLNAMKMATTVAQTQQLYGIVSSAYDELVRGSHISPIHPLTPHLIPYITPVTFPHHTHHFPQPLHTNHSQPFHPTPCADLGEAPEPPALRRRRAARGREGGGQSAGPVQGPVADPRDEAQRVPHRGLS